MERVPGPLKLIGAFLLPILMGRLLEGVLGSRWLQARLRAGGHDELLSEEGRRMTGKYVKAGAGLVGAGLAVVPARVEAAVAAAGGRRRVNWRFWIKNVADLCLGLGAALRVIAEFLEEKRQIRRSVVNRQRSG